MADSKLIFEEKFKIRASEVNVKQEATLPSICNLLQEIAGNHARHLQFDITDLQQNKLTWVLHRLRLQVDRLPRWRENITIKTWPSGGDGLRAHRDFIIVDEDRNVLGRALSYWLILDIQNRRPIRIPENILNSVPRDSEHVLPVEKGDFTEIASYDSHQKFTVRRSDLDLNRHVNNVRYIEWALSCLPEGPGPSDIDIKFLGEAHLNEEVVAKAQITDPHKRYEIRRSSDGKVLALACSN